MIFASSFRRWVIIGIDLAWRMSSVFGLKAKPRMAICLFLSFPRNFLLKCIAL